MLREAIEYVAKLGVKANNTHIIKPEAEPSHVYYLQDAAGVKKVEAEPPPRSHKAFSLDAIIDEAGTASLNGGSIWYGPDGVVLLLDAKRRDSIAVETKLSEPFARLQELKANKSSLTQAQLILELRTTFGDCLAPAGEIIPTIRKLKFNVGQAGESDIGHGRSSVGKTLTAEVTGTATLPEYVTLSVPIFATACFRAIRQNIKCALEPDAGTQTFKVLPLPGQLEYALDSGVGAIGYDIEERLKKAGTGIAVHYGRP